MASLWTDSAPVDSARWRERKVRQGTRPAAFGRLARARPRGGRPEEGAGTRPSRMRSELSIGRIFPVGLFSQEPCSARATTSIARVVTRRTSRARKVLEPAQCTAPSPLAREHAAHWLRRRLRRTCRASGRGSRGRCLGREHASGPEPLQRRARQAVPGRGRVWHVVCRVMARPGTRILAALVRLVSLVAWLRAAAPARAWAAGARAVKHRELTVPGPPHSGKKPSP